MTWNAVTSGLTGVVIGAVGTVGLLTALDAPRSSETSTTQAATAQLITYEEGGVVYQPTALVMWRCASNTSVRFIARSLARHTYTFALVDGDAAVPWTQDTAGIDIDVIQGDVESRTGLELAVIPIAPDGQIEVEVSLPNQQPVPRIMLSAEPERPMFVSPPGMGACHDDS